MFEKVNNIEFNCFELQKITKGQELSYLLIYLFEINDLYTELSINPKVKKKTYNINKNYNIILLLSFSLIKFHYIL